MGSYAPDEVVAQVRALALTGYRAPTIAQRVNVPERTVYRWLTEWQELATEQDKELLDQERRIALLSARLFEDKIESALKDPSQTRLTEAGIAYGISRDKQFKRQELALKERDQSQLMGDLLEAIKHEAAKLAESTRTQEATQSTVAPSHETRLLTTAQDAEQST